METENKRERQFKESSDNVMRRAIDQLGIGSIILFWSSLLILKQAGLIDSNVSTWPFALAALGILLLVGSIYRLNTWKTRERPLLQRNKR